MKSNEFLAKDGTVRQSYYGLGVQPFDTIVGAGWGPAFSAGNVLKYLRRDKDIDHSRESARWYWQQLIKYSEHSTEWLKTLRLLCVLLTENEKELLLP